LLPGQACLGITVETIQLAPGLCGLLEGRSRFARLGLFVHITAGFMQPGINNRQVLEIYNASNVTPISTKTNKQNKLFLNLAFFVYVVASSHTLARHSNMSICLSQSPRQSSVQWHVQRKCTLKLFLFQTNSITSSKNNNHNKNTSMLIWNIIKEVLFEIYE
jgi:hypothetical protein